MGQQMLVVPSGPGHLPSCANPQHPLHPVKRRSVDPPHILHMANCPHLLCRVSTQFYLRKWAGVSYSVLGTTWIVLYFMSSSQPHFFLGQRLPGSLATSWTGAGWQKYCDFICKQSTPPPKKEKKTTRRRNKGKNGQCSLMLPSCFTCMTCSVSWILLCSWLK